MDVRSQSFGYDPTSDDNANVADLSANTFLVPWVASAGNGNDDPGVTPGTPTTGGDAMRPQHPLGGRHRRHLDSLARPTMRCAVYSSWGPTPGGRKKPDLVAPGTAITGPAIGGGIDTNDGTSLSAPHVGGALAILAGAGMTDPRSMRAVLVNSAEPWCNGHFPGHDPPQGTPLVDDPNYGSAPGAGVCQTGWEPDVGWGEVDVQNAIAERGNAVTGDVEVGKARFYSCHSRPGRTDDSRLEHARRPRRPT